MCLIAPSKKWKLKDNALIIYLCLSFEKRKKSLMLSSSQPRPKQRLRRREMNKCLLMAYPSIKTNINKLVFTTHALPAVKNAAVYVFNNTSSLCNKTPSRTFFYRRKFMHFSLFVFYAYSNTLTLFMTALFTRLNNISIILCDFDIKFHQHQQHQHLTSLTSRHWNNRFVPSRQKCLIGLKRTTSNHEI